MTGISFIPVIVVAIVAVRRIKLINRFKNTDTTSASNAKDLNELNISRRLLFIRLVNHGVIIEENGKYYLNEQNLIEYRTKRRMILIPFIVLILMLAIFMDITLT